VSVKTLRQFGCECFVLIPDHERSKLDKKSRKGIFVGYDVEEQGYRVYISEKRQVEVSCNVLFKENFEFDTNSTEIYLSNENQNLNEEKSGHENERQEESNEESSDDNESYESTEETSEEELKEIENVESNSLNQGRNLRDRRHIKPPSRFNDYHTGFIGEVENVY